jgi:hypothetical protein
MNRRMGALPWVAYTQLEFAKMRLGRDAPGDREAAHVTLREAESICAALDMVFLSGKVADLLTSFGAAEGTRGKPAMTAMAGHAAAFRREGEYWSIVFDGDAFRLRDSKGLRYLSHLLDAPGREIHALELVAAVEGQEPRPDRMKEELYPGCGRRRCALGPPGQSRVQPANTRAGVRALRSRGMERSGAGLPASRRARLVGSRARRRGGPGGTRPQGRLERGACPSQRHPGDPISVGASRRPQSGPGPTPRNGGPDRKLLLISARPTGAGLLDDLKAFSRNSQAVHLGRTIVPPELTPPGRTGPRGGPEEGGSRWSCGCGSRGRRCCSPRSLGPFQAPIGCQTVLNSISAVIS